MTKKIYLHIGFHKTGTTALQQFLGNHVSELKEYGVFYPKPLGSWPSHPELAWAVTGNIFSWQDRHYSVEEVFNYYSDEITNSSQEVVVISSEEFCRLNYYEGTIPLLARLFSNYDTRIIAYVRSAKDFLASRYRHEVKNQSEKRIFQDYVANADNLDSARFSKRIAPWIAAFGDDVNIRMYERNKLIGESIVSDFLNVIGINQFIQKEITLQYQELEIPPSLAIFLSSVNRINIDSEKKNRIYDFAFSIARIMDRQNANELFNEIDAPPSIIKMLEDLDLEISNIIESRNLLLKPSTDKIDNVIETSVMPLVP